MYNSSSVFYTSRDSSSSLAVLEQVLQADSKHIVLEDFNLHHLLWAGVARPTQHTAADQLLDIADAVQFTLCLPQGMIIWEARNTSSIINLIFATSELHQRLQSCFSASELNQFSDHLSVKTVFNFKTQIASERKTKV